MIKFYKLSAGIALIILFSTTPFFTSPMVPTDSIWASAFRFDLANTSD
ncbi:MAG: hypothetical protein ACFFB5_24200 [Promethearchaeota archaeon]